MYLSVIDVSSHSKHSNHSGIMGRRRARSDHKDNFLTEGQRYSTLDLLMTMI